MYAKLRKSDPWSRGAVHAEDRESGEPCTGLDVGRGVGVTDGDFEVRRRNMWRLYRDRGGRVVARVVVVPTLCPVVVPRDERRADGAVRGDRVAM